jgi:hypothetical protein
VLALAVVYPLDFATIRMAANLGAHDPGKNSRTAVIKDISKSAAE